MIVYDGDVYCEECLPDFAHDEDIYPLEKGDEPVCCNCSCVENNIKEADDDQSNLD